MTMGWMYLFELLFSFSSTCTPRSGIDRLYGCSTFRFLRNLLLFFMWSPPFPSNKCSKKFPLSTSSPTFVICRPFMMAFWQVGDVPSSCCDSHFSLINDFHVLVTLPYVFSIKMPVRAYAYFWFLLALELYKLFIYLDVNLCWSYHLHIFFPLYRLSIVFVSGFLSHHQILIPK